MNNKHEKEELDENDTDFVKVNSHCNAKWTGEYRNVCLSRPPEYSFYG